MPAPLKVSFLEGLIDGGLPYPSIVAVEFDPDSLWFESVYTLAAQALSEGRGTDIHVFQKSPEEVKAALKTMGVDVAGEMRADRLRIIDSYSVQLGLGEAPSTGESDDFMTKSVRLADWSAAVKAEIVGGVAESDRGRIHIDVNLTVLARYNSEEEIVDYWRTRMIPLMRARGNILVSGLAAGFAGEPFYRQMASLSEAILDVKATEVGGNLQHSLRVRTARGRSHDSTWQTLTLSEAGQVLRSSSPSGPGGVAVSSPAQLLAALDPDGTLQELLSSLTEVELDRYRVVGSYTRFDESTRQLLKDFNLRLVAGTTSSSSRHDNFLLWAPPGGGKTFLIHEIVAALGDRVRLVEVNLAQSDEAAFRKVLREAARGTEPLIVFVDEVDSKPSEPWPYEALLPALEPPAPPPHPVTFVLAGSSGANEGEFASGIRARPKGADLLSRIPPENVLSLPPMTSEDRMLVAVSNLHAAADKEGRGISEIEKLALCYVALSPRLANARQLREFIVRGLERTPAGDDRIKFDNLFAPGDTESKEFWMGVRSVNPQLVGRFVRIAG